MNTQTSHPVVQLMRRIHERCTSILRLPTGVATKNDWIEMHKAMESGCALELHTSVS